MPSDGHRRGGSSLKHRIIERWVRRRLGRIAHERRVVAIAQTMFDLTHHLHGLDGSHRQLLALAALVHDVGRAINEDTHPVQGAKLLLRESWLPLAPAERRWLAYLTRHHRGAVPKPGRDDHLLDGDDHTSLRLLLALLRAADSLDSRSQESPHVVIACRGRRLSVTCYLDNDTPKARKVYGRRKKHRLLEELLDLRVDIDVRAGEPVGMVAA
jgi:exopolyphosphatase / guanosine-5'-triphosphate,3'-diphosphate pyrophosphatase